MTSQKIAIGLVAFFLFTGCMTAHADDVSKGLKAYNRGDYATALRIFRQISDQGYAKAQFNLGVMYNKGEGVTQDYGEAAKWYRKAADQGNAKAQFNLGFMYSKGQGVPLDYKEAVKWYRKATAQRHAAAQYNLGVLYDNGWGVPQDYGEAVEWYRKAATQNQAAAQFNLGVMYSKGQTGLISGIGLPALAVTPSPWNLAPRFAKASPIQGLPEAQMSALKPHFRPPLGGLKVTGENFLIF